MPDIVLPSVLDALELGETTLPYYLQYDTVPAGQLTESQSDRSVPTDLKANSRSRVAASPDFAYVRQDIAYYKKKVKDSTVSLNEAVRLKEQADLKGLEARKKDLVARKWTRDKVLDLTLDMVRQISPPRLPWRKSRRSIRPMIRCGTD